jgi:hypothetical protein
MIKSENMQEKNKCIILVEKPTANIPLLRHNPQWENNIKINIEV